MCHTTWRHVSILSESESARRERLNTDSTNRRISEEELSLRRITGDFTACTIKFSYQNFHDCHSTCRDSDRKGAHNVFIFRYIPHDSGFRSSANVLFRLQISIIFISQNFLNQQQPASTSNLLVNLSFILWAFLV